MSDSDKIRDRIRKLMAYANDGAASDGEIENAMRHAARLMDAHHIEASEIAEDQEHRRDDATMGCSAGVTTTTRLATWEATLAAAVSNLFGCVKHYIISGEPVAIRENGIAKVDDDGNLRRGRQMMFYGPLVEAQEAAELFSEWARSIAAMGVIRWGGCYRGDGAMYCQGFADAVRAKARKINKERAAIPARAPALLEGATTTAITLTGRYEMLKEKASDWLKTEMKVELISGGRRTGYRAGSDAAFAEGKSHGNAAHFARDARRKMPGNGG